MSNTITDPKILFHSSKVLLLYWKTGKIRCVFLPTEVKCTDPSLRLPLDKLHIVSEARVDERLEIHYRIGKNWHHGSKFELVALSFLSDSSENIFSSITSRKTA
jgi:hypothetical protein